MAGAVTGEQQDGYAGPVGLDDRVARAAEGRVDFVAGRAGGFDTERLAQSRSADQSDAQFVTHRTGRLRADRRVGKPRSRLGRAPRSPGVAADVRKMPMTRLSNSMLVLSSTLR